MKSMTGYGKCHINKENIDCEIEIKSVNGRYLDLKLYIPRELGFFEFIIRKVIPTYISRGSVELRINLSDMREPKLILNTRKLHKYYDIILQAQAALGYKTDISMEFLLAEPGIVESKNLLDEDELLRSILDECLHQACREIVASMEKEAEGIARGLYSSMDIINEALQRITGQIQPFKEEMHQNMHKRIEELVGKYELENMEQRILQELAMYIDKYDIQEEITRLNSHIITFREALQIANKDIGKTLNFISQEMQREANTLGSKFSNSLTFKDILIIKEEIEKCREIVQNVS